MKRTLKRVSATLTRLFNFIYPVIFAVVTNNAIATRLIALESDPAGQSLWAAGRGLTGAARREVAVLFADDIARLRRLEDKLSSQMTIVSILLGISAVAGGLSLGQSSTVGMLSTGGAFVWLASAGLLSLSGSSARKIYLPDVVESVDGGHADLESIVTADRLRAMKLNASVGLRINNTIFACQRCIAVATVLLLIAGVVTSLNQLR